MISNFDDESQMVLMKANKEMSTLKHPYVGSEHLLLSILSFEELDSCKFLNDCGIFYNNFKEKLIDIIGYGSKENTWFLKTPLLKNIINNSIVFSKDNNQFVSVNILFYFLLSEGEGIANRIINLLNVNNDLILKKYTYIFKSKFLPNLDKFGENMNEKYKKEGFEYLYGREFEIERIVSILLRKNKNNPILVGDAGVGKTAIVEEVVRRIEERRVPASLYDYVIFNISVSALVSGTKYRGEFEERINMLIDSIKGKKNIILFIDEVHTLIGAGGAEGAIDASNILKPFLARGDIKLIGATTSEEYKKYIVKDQAFTRRLQKVYIKEMTCDDTLSILKKIKPDYEKYHNVIINDEILDKIILFSHKYVNQGKLPDKAIDLLDEICSYTSLKSCNNSSSFNDTIDLLDIQKKKNAAILNKDFKKANYYRKKEISICKNYNNMIQLNKNYVTEENLYNIIYNKTGIPIKILCESGSAINKLNHIIIGQRDGISKIINYITKKVNYDFNMPSVLITGRLGSGKSFFISQYVKELNLTKYYIELDLSNYEVYYNIFGSVDCKEKSLVDFVKDNPFSIIYLKNINSCSNKISNIIEGLFKNRYLINIYNEKVYFNHCIIFSSVDSCSCYPIGFEIDNRNILTNCYLETYFEKVVNFTNLSYNSIFKIIHNIILLKKYDEKFFSTEIVNKIIEKSEYKKYGAKKIEKLINNEYYNDKLITC